MARPIKHNADYFSHDCNMRNDMKVKALRRKYKALGYATYIMMLELLTEQDHFEIEWNDMNIELLTPDFDIDVEELSEIINYCIKLNLFQITNGYLHCNTLTERLEEDVLKKRKGYDRNNAKRYGVNSELIPNKDSYFGINEVITNINQESKVKEIKENKTKINEIELNEMQEYADEQINQYWKDREEFVEDMHTYMDIRFAKDSLDKLTEYIDDNNIPAAKKILSDIIDDYKSFDNILQLCYGDDINILNNWRDYFRNTLQFIN
jgi:hypothetical protein